MTRPQVKTVTAAELGANVTACVRAVRAGQQLIVCDCETPVARLVPYETVGDVLAVRRPVRALHDFRLPAPLKSPVDSLAALIAERQLER